MIPNGFWPLLYTYGYHHRFAAEPPSSCSSWFLHDMFTWWYLERYFHRATFTSLYHLVVATLWITSANIIDVRSRNRWRKIDMARGTKAHQQALQVGICYRSSTTQKCQGQGPKAWQRTWKVFVENFTTVFSRFIWWSSWDWFGLEKIPNFFRCRAGRNLIDMLSP